MDFYEVIRTRRSVRSYEPDPIPEKILNNVLDSARVAPSGSNRQPWEFIIIKDKKSKSQLATLCGNQRFIADAPVVIVACGRNIHFDRGGYMGDMSMLMDVSIAFTHLILAARAEGLGTCWIGLFNNEEVKMCLNIANDMNVVAISPIGFPKGEVFTEHSPRKPLTEIVRILS